MIQILLIEDEKPAREKLKNLVEQCLPQKPEIIECGSIREALIALEKYPTPDLIFMDIQLSDGNSLSLFQQVEITAPVIFTTAYEEYWLQSFDANSIDYVLKPYDKNDIAEAIAKYQKLNRHFQQKNLNALLKERPRTRMLVKKGFAFLSLNLTDVAYFYTEHKLTMLKDRHGERYIVDKPLSELETELQGSGFFRLNRQFLCNIQSIKNFKTYAKGRLYVSLEPPAEEEVLVSQENAFRFKKWMDGLPSLVF